MTYKNQDSVQATNYNSVMKGWAEGISCVVSLLVITVWLQTVLLNSLTGMLTSMNVVLAQGYNGCCLMNRSEGTDQVHLPSIDTKTELTYSMQHRCGTL